MKEASLTYQKLRRATAEADPDDREKFHVELKKRRELDATVVCIDQIKKSVQVEPRAAGFASGTHPSIELSGQRGWTCLLGMTTENGDRFFARFEEYVIPDHAKHFIPALCKEFQEYLSIVLDGAPYFQATAVPDLTARDDLALVGLPTYSPELNPVEECWRQLNATLGNRFFESLDNSTQRSTMHSIVSQSPV